jgi:hypothetical protein
VNIAIKAHERKYGIWLSNFTSHKDDEWIYVWATDGANANWNATKYHLFDDHRFAISATMPIKYFAQRKSIQHRSGCYK